MKVALQRGLSNGMVRRDWTGPPAGHRGLEPTHERCSMASTPRHRARQRRRSAREAGPWTGSDGPRWRWAWRPRRPPSGSACWSPRTPRPIPRWPPDTPTTPTSTSAAHRHRHHGLLRIRPARPPLRRVHADDDDHPRPRTAPTTTTTGGRDHLGAVMTPPARTDAAAAARTATRHPLDAGHRHHGDGGGHRSRARRRRLGPAGRGSP